MHQLSIVNHTEVPLGVTLGFKGCDVCLVQPSCRETLASTKWTTLATLKLEGLSEKGLRSSRSSAILKLKSRSSHLKYGWELVECDRSFPCTVYRAVLTKTQNQLVVFPKRSLSSFLADMPSSLSLSSLMLPGTHNSVAFYGWPVSQCQVSTTPLSVQFASGIRVLDARLSIINGVLISYHGIYPQKLPFLDIIQAVHTFLSSSDGKNETIIMSVKQEDQASLLFSQLVHDAVYKGPGGKDMWFLKNRIPTLGEVRGKIVLLSRFGGNGQGWEGGLEGLGIHPTTWPDSKEGGFEWWLKGTKVKTHDWYSIPSFLALPEKATRASQILLQPTPSPPYPVQSITFLSAASFPLALPKLVACGFGWPSWGLGLEGVNSRVGKWILGLLSGTHSNLDVKAYRDGYMTLTADSQIIEPRLRGWCFIDYFKEPMEVGLVNLLIECNYRGRKAGEEGWP